MDNKQLTSQTLRVLGIVVILAMLFVLNWIAKERMPDILTYVFPVILGTAFIGVSIYKYRLDMKIPGKPLEEFTSFLVIVTVLLIALMLPNFENNLELSYTMLFLIGLMWSARTIFKQQQNRIDKLEEELKHQKRLQKLNQQNQSEE